jgi:pimeloyl-ACP methyl ester carboxylesterase
LAHEDGPDLSPVWALNSSAMCARLSVVVLAVVGSLSSIAGAVSGQSALRIAPYSVQGFDGGSHSAELVRIWVPEDRSRPPLSPPAEGAPGWIDLAGIRLRSTAAAPASPIIFLMGGPGVPASTIARVPIYWQLFDRLRSVADVILLDQRGLGETKPTLDCPPPSEPLPTNLFESADAFVATYRRVVAGCAALWRDRQVEPGAYTTIAIADDVDELRRALGAERVNLLAFSYGTHVALEVVRRYPTAVDRLVFAATLGPNHTVRLPSAFDAVFRAAAAGAAGTPGLPASPEALEAAFRRAVERFPDGPITLTSDVPTSPALTLHEEGFRLLVGSRVGDPRMPAMVTAAADGDWSVVASVAAGTYTDFSQGGGSLMARAVACSSPGSPGRREQADRESASSLFGSPIENAVVSRDFCDIVGTRDGGTTPTEPVSSTRPAIFITGSLDDRTPWAAAEEVRAGFPNGTHVLVENGGHETLPLDAVQRLVVEFFRTGEVSSEPISLPPRRYPTIEEARLPPRPPGSPGD